MAVITSTTSTILRQRARIMARAWELFRDHYNFPRTPFRSIGRHCFGGCLKAAWAELREVVRLAGFGVEETEGGHRPRLSEPV